MISTFRCTLLLFVLSFSYSVAWSQLQVTMGTLEYTTVVPGSDTLELQVQETIKESSLSYAFAPGFFRKHQVTATISSSITILDQEQEKGLLLRTQFGHATYRVADLWNVSPGMMYVGEVQLFDETKEILGYTCRKATISVHTMAGEGEITFWYTDAIYTFAVPLMFHPDLPGFPLETTSSFDKMEVTVTATSFEPANPNKELFSLTPPEGYTEFKPPSPPKSTNDSKKQGEEDLEIPPPPPPSTPPPTIIKPGDENGGM